jgi:adenylosuccinate synthase
MRKASIVLGLAFGDEGKGITTDYLCSLNPNSKKIVVRFSGGHQAGHCVRVGDKTHIFSNFGSGTLRGIPSYFSEHCTIYPITMSKELQVLRNLGIEPTYYVHPLAKLTTPMDGVYNRMQEKRNNHGSCGVGIGTTMNRHLNTGYKLYVMDLMYDKVFYEKLRNIENYYVSLLSNEEKTNFLQECDKIMPVYEEALRNIDKLKTMWYQKLTQYDHIIFEGSQGILLDMDHGFFPNVTYANTTSKNAVEICKILDISYIETYYVTRCYQTRHGNGWMSNSNQIELINNEEETNVTNEWQGRFKISEIDYKLLRHALAIDLLYTPTQLLNLVVTCLDQRPEFILDEDFRDYFFHVYGSFSKDSKDFVNL